VESTRTFSEQPAGTILRAAAGLVTLAPARNLNGRIQGKSLIEG
jgi:hypothetical protein